MLNKKSENKNKELKVNKEQKNEIRCFGITQKELDASVLSRLPEDRSMFALSILSDAQETSNPTLRNQWINKAKYIIGVHLGGK